MQKQICNKSLIEIFYFYFIKCSVCVWGVYKFYAVSLTSNQHIFVKLKTSRVVNCD